MKNETPIQAETSKPILSALLAASESFAEDSLETEPQSDNATNETREAMRKCAESIEKTFRTGKRDTSHMNSNETPKTKLDYKLGGTDDPHFQDHIKELSRTEATCDWFDRMDDWHESLRDDGRSDGYGESYSDRNT